MKNAIKIFISLFAGLLACEDVETLTPVPDTTQAGYTAKFLFMNASPDAPSLDLFINNLKTGASVTSGQGQASYSAATITSGAVITSTDVRVSSVSASVSANTSIRSKATSGSIGGALGTNDLIFRAGNANTNNFLAIPGASYTIFAVDTITRPKPERKLNAKNLGDTTYFNPLTGKYISTVDRASLSAAQKARLVPIGTVPLGSSDPGGIRYLVVTDEWPLPSTLRLPVPIANRFAARFINLSPDAGTVSATINAIAVTGLSSYPFIWSTSSATGFNPSVGSRNTSGSGSTTAPVTAAFINNFGGLTPGTYTISTNTTAASLPYDFANGGIYTVVLSGLKSKGTLTLSVIKHN